MKSCYSSTELATKVAFVIRRVGNFGEGNNSNFIFIMGLLNSFSTCKKSKRFFFVVFNSFTPFPFTLCFTGTHSNAFNVFLFVWDLAKWGCLFDMCVHAL